MNTFNEFAPQWLHNKVKDQVLSPYLTWNFPNFGGKSSDISEACFCHCPFDWQYEYSNWSGVDSLQYVLDCWLDTNKSWFNFKGLNRCIVNFYTASQYTNWHTDHANDSFFSLLYYVNSADGGTEFRDRKILHKENTGLFFNSTIEHRPIQSTVPRRISINWVIEGKIK
jgi:hypothetical protein